MNHHATEEQLILHYYGEPDADRRVHEHITTCVACREELERLTRVLGLVDGEALNPLEAPGPAFEREVWVRLQPQLTFRQHGWFSRLIAGFPVQPPRWRALTLAGGVAALVLVAFLAGRFSNDVVPSSTAPVTASTDIAQRVLVIAVVDHLDRSQMVLLDVLNADFDSHMDFAAEQSTARDLVSASRLYRQSAVQAGDEATSDVLDELERVLLEIANAPQDASKEDLEVLRAQIAARGVLFKVRVVHSEMRERERQNVTRVSESKS